MDQSQDREWVRTSGDRQARRRFHSAMREQKREALRERERLGMAFAQGHGIIDSNSGIGTIDLSVTAEYAAAAVECARILDEVAGKTHPSKGSLDFIASGKNYFGPESACVALAMSPRILGPVTQYFGALPILFSLGLTRAQATSMIESSSHLFHLDPEDVTQIKAFVHLGEVEPDRAFYALPADLTEKVVATMPNYGVGRLSDEAVAAVVGPNAAFCGAGSAGQVIFCDTTRCLHYGGRPGRLVRDTLVLHYALPTSTWFPICGENAPRRNLMPLLRPTGDETWDALIGERAI